MSRLMTTKPSTRDRHGTKALIGSKGPPQLLSPAQSSHKATSMMMRNQTSLQKKRKHHIEPFSTHEVSPDMLYQRMN